MFDFVFLGTGAMKPTPKRFTSSIMLRYNGEVLMFDVGEGIQIRVGQSGFSPMKVDKIFITHFHGDHFYGLPGMIFTMAKGGRTKKLRIYGPPRAKEFVNQIMTLGYGHVPFEIEVNELNHDDVVKGKNYTVKAFRTDHGPPSIGYLFREEDSFNIDSDRMKKEGIKSSPKFRLLKEGKTIEIDGKKLEPSEWLIPVKGDSFAYTGDTKYSESVAEYVKGVTVLVHESTYLEKDGSQFDRGHSSVEDAAKLAKKAKVNTLFLIHISPRYMDLSVLKDAAIKIFPQTYISRDLDKWIVKKNKLVQSK